MTMSKREKRGLFVYATVIHLFLIVAALVGQQIEFVLPLLIIDLAALVIWVTWLASGKIFK